MGAVGGEGCLGSATEDGARENGDGRSRAKLSRRINIVRQVVKRSHVDRQGR